ncbi:MAG: response regulator transcription factor [Desulfarculus sp.]|nr:response regulator transcription factor [Desulfarculus sp.]
MNKIRVLIADDHAVVRSGLRQLMADQPDLEVVGEAGDGREALEKVKALKPDVIVLDIAMPGVSGLEAAGLIKEAVPSCQIVVLTMHGKENFVRQVLSSGALAYVLKASPVQDVLAAVRAAHRGEYFLSSKIEAEVVGAYLDSRRETPAVRGYDLLSEREQQIFRLVAEGNSTNQIAEVLCVSPKTVEKHRTNIMKKLGLRDRLDVVKYAVRIGIIDPQLWEG